MSVEGRLRNVERRLGQNGAPRPRPVIIITGAAGGGRERRSKEEVHRVAREITSERVRRAWPPGLTSSQVSPQDVDAWLDGRREEALRGIGHRPAMVDAMGFRLK